MPLNTEFTKLLLAEDAAFKALQALIKGDKKAEKLKKGKNKVDFYDYVYQTYEDDIEDLVKKFRLDWDTLGSYLMDLGK